LSGSRRREGGWTEKDDVELETSGASTLSGVVVPDGVSKAAAKSEVERLSFRCP
jgi:hypothetical protein